MNNYLNLLFLIFLFNGCGSSITEHYNIKTKYKLSELKTDTQLFTPLTWENKIHRKAWSAMIYSIIENEIPEYTEFNDLTDIELFCPNYKKIQKPLKMNFWGQFISAISFYESTWNPAEVTPENHGVDPVTGLQTRSEGLLQLSYRDQLSYKIDCGFDWKQDQFLSENDRRRTILDPYQNLRCGLKIMAIQLKRDKKIITSNTKQYWKVLWADQSTLEKIKSITLKLPFCGTQQIQ